MLAHRLRSYPAREDPRGLCRKSSLAVEHSLLVPPKQTIH